MKTLSLSVLLAALLLPLAACETHSSETVSRNPLTGTTTVHDTTVQQNPITGSSTVTETKSRVP